VRVRVRVRVCVHVLVQSQIQQIRIIGKSISAGLVTCVLALPLILVFLPHGVFGSTCMRCPHTFASLRRLA